jgi:uncharacterized protein
MKCYLKVHSRGSEVVIGACDEDCIGKKLKEGRLCFNVSEIFFKDTLVSIEDALKILKKTPNFNAVGKNIINALIQSNIIHPEAIVEIEKIPVAIKILL